MNINNMDGLTRADRMVQVNNYSNVLKQNIITTNTNINTIDTNTDIAIRTISANAKLDGIISYQTPLINADAAAIILASNTQSVSNILQITSTQTLNSAAEIVVYKAQITSARQAILDSVAAEVAALTAAGTPPTVAHEDDMYKIALGYPAAVSRGVAETLYYNDNVKLILDYPNAVSVVQAEAFYTQSRINVGLGFSYYVNIINGLGSNVANATATLAADSVTSVTITNRGLGYTSSPDIIFTGGGGTGTNASASIAYVVTSITIDNPGHDYNSIKEVKFMGGGGTGAKALVTLLYGKVYQIDILDGGSGYITAPTVEFINGNRSNGTGATATVIIGNGYISAVSITTGGSGYTLAPTVTFVKNSFQATADGLVSMGTTGVITSLNIINAGNRYVTIPYVVFNGGGSGGYANVSLGDGGANRSVSTINLISGGTGYDFTSTITNVQTETVYTNYYLKLAFGYPDDLSTATAQQSYFNNAMKILLGYPNATTLEKAKTSYFDVYMETLLTHPELIITSQTDQDQMYKDAFGFPGATSVKGARNSYRSATMSSLLTGVVIERPLSHPKKRRDMDIVSEKGVYVAPKVERKENQLPTNETHIKHQVMSIGFQSGDTRKEQMLDANLLNTNTVKARDLVNIEIKDTYNSVSFTYRSTVALPIFNTEKTNNDSTTTSSRTTIITNATNTYTASAAVIQAVSDVAGPAASAKIISDNTPIITYQRTQLIANVDANVDSVVANTNVYTNKINNKEEVITKNANVIAKTVADQIALYGTYNPPSQAIQDQMYKDAYGYPVAGSVAIALQSYIDDNLKKELGFPNAASVNDAKTDYIELNIKTELGFLMAVSVAAAAILAKDYRKRFILGYVDAVDASAAEAAYLADGLRAALGFPLEVTEITITNEGKRYESAPIVNFTGGGTYVMTAKAHTILDKNGKVVNIIITDKGKRYESAPTIVLSGGGGVGATANVTNVFSSSQANAETLFEDNYSKNALGYPNTSSVSVATQDYINTGIKLELGFPNVETVNDAESLYNIAKYKTLFGYPNVTSDNVLIDIRQSEEIQTIYGYATDFLDRYDHKVFPNSTEIEAAELIWFYDKMKEYLSTVPPGMTQDEIDQLYKDGFGFPAGSSITVKGSGYMSIPSVDFSGGGGNDNAVAIATINTQGEVDTVTMTDQGTGYTHPPTVVINKDPTDESGDGARIVVTVSGGQVSIVIPVVDAQNAYYHHRIKEIFLAQIVNSISTSLIIKQETGMNIGVQDITHNERVYGRKPSPTKTKRSAMILTTGHILNLNNPPTDINKQRTMSINSNRKKIDRHTRINQCNNYTRFYKQAEAIVKYKIIQGANSTPPIHYTPTQQKQMLYNELKKIKTGPPPKQQPVPPPPVGKSFGLIEEEGEIRLGSLTHKERVNAALTNEVLQNSIEQLITKIEQDNGGSAISTLTSDEVTSVQITPGGEGNNFKYPPLVDFVGGGGFGAYAIATLNADKQLDNINVTHGGIGYVSTPTVTFRISAEEKAELEDEYWYSTVRARWMREEAIYPQPPKY